MINMYMGIDQYGQSYSIKKHPRKELMDYLGATHADKMYCEPDAAHVGYVIRGLWITVYKLSNAFEAKGGN